MKKPAADLAHCCPPTAKPDEAALARIRELDTAWTAEWARYAELTGVELPTDRPRAPACNAVAGRFAYRTQFPARRAAYALGVAVDEIEAAQYAAVRGSTQATAYHSRRAEEELAKARDAVDHVAATCGGCGTTPCSCDLEADLRSDEEAA